MPRKPKYPTEFRGNFIDGQFVEPADPNGEWSVHCPGDQDDVIATLQYTFADVDRVVTSARSAYRDWSRKSVLERTAYLKKYRQALEARGEELAEVIAREVGKPVWEAKTEVTGMVNKLQITIDQSMKLVADFKVPEALPGVRGACRYRSMGPQVVVGPFNFPGHLPNGHILPALLTGNTVIFKPSEKTPIVGQIMAECFDAAGLPKGVFNLLQGEKEMGRRLVTHEGVAGILFTGSYEVGTRIKQDTLQQHWKLLALEMGGKNAAIVCQDAQMPVALREIFLGAYLTTGQRCSATSRILVHRSLVDEFVAKFHERSKAFTIGHPFDEPFMGPLIDSQTVDRYMKFQGIAKREGCETIMHGKALDLEVEGNYVAPSICLVKDSSLQATRKSVYQQTELFAPNVAILPFDEIEEAVAQANATQFGLVCSVFSQSEEIFREAAEELEVGLVNWNKSTVGASSKLPFGGIRKSGNHFPTALFATQYCTYPVASLEVGQPSTDAPSMPGINWG